MSESAQAVKEKQRSILVVDDDQAMCETLVDILEDKGYKTASSSSAVAAIELLKKEPVDLVLLDIMMPEMNGVEALDAVKHAVPHAIIIVMTGHSNLEGYVSEALASGVDGVLYKPFDIDVVLDIIERSEAGRERFPLVDLSQYPVQANAIQMVPQELARKHCVLPLRIENNILNVAMCDPTDLMAIEDLRVRTGLRIKTVRARREDLDKAISEQYEDLGAIERQVQRFTFNTPEAAEQQADRVAAEAVSQTPVVRAIDLMLQQAVRDRASDIHIEPQDDHLRVRYRIDGVLQDAIRLPKRVHPAIISRIKVLSALNIAERRRPQDGQFNAIIDGRSIDFRVATANTVNGEMAVLRVLDKQISVKSLPDLGFLPDMLERYKKVTTAPWGIILIAGPTGSGKTSTLYATLHQLDSTELKIITIEDPVEYRFEGISQMQVNHRANVTFASGMRAAVRLDPDVILVGEIRDEETATTAVQASLTGHLVFSTIHANDPVGAVLRLADLGVEPFLITSSLLGVLSQRLVRKVCPQCKVLQEVPFNERAAYQEILGEDMERFWVGTGCSYCAQTGYRGRVALFDFMELDDNLRKLILQGASSAELREHAHKAGSGGMMEDGMLKVKQGITTPGEVLKRVFEM